MKLFIFINFLWMHSYNFEANVVKYRLKEESDINTLIGNIFEDSRSEYMRKPKENFTYKIYTTDIDSNLTKLDFKGHLLVNKRIDREFLCPNVDKIDDCQLELMIHAFPDHWIKVFIIIEDINDNKPKFPTKEKRIKVSESIAVGNQLPLQTAMDEDLEYFGVQSYNLEDSEPFFSLLYRPMFSLTLVVLKKLDFENISHRYFNLTLIACDGGTPVQCDKQKLQIEVTDSNDNNPIFDQTQNYKFIKESTPIGSVIFIFNASDADSGLFGKINFKLLPARTTKNKVYFNLNFNTGELVLITSLNAKIVSKFILDVEARDENGVGPFSSQCQLTIRVQDENNHAPILSLGDRESLTIMENSPAGEHVGMVIASDGDLEDNGKVTCVLLKNDSNYLALDRSHNMKDEIIYRLVTTRVFDRELLDYFTIMISCQDYGNPPHRSFQLFNVSVGDINEFPPSFYHSNYSIFISEDIEINSALIQIKALDKDKTHSLNYHLDPSVNDKFQIDINKGILKNIVHFDREVIPKYIVPVFVTDQVRGTILTGTTTVYITVTDVNDNTPVMTGIKQFVIRENVQILTYGNLIGELQTQDLDNSYNATVVCDLLSVHVLSNHMSWIRLLNHSFKIDKYKCNLFVKSSLDREQIDKYKLNIIISDLGIPKRSNMEIITVMVDDENDNSPIWRYQNNQTAYQVNVTAETNLNHPIILVQATDIDAKKNSNISYNFVNNDVNSLWYEKYFTILTRNGGIFMSRDLQESGTYYLKIQATDNGSPPRFSDVTIITVKISTAEKTNYLIKNSQISFTLIVVTSLASFSICVALMVGIILMWRKSYPIQLNSDRTTGNWDDPKTLQWEISPFVDVDHRPNESIVLNDSKFYNSMTSDLCNICVADPLLTQFRDFPQNRIESNIPNQNILQSSGHLQFRQFSPDFDSSSVDSGHGASEYNPINSEAKFNRYHHAYGNSTLREHLTLQEESQVLSEDIISSSKPPQIYQNEYYNQIRCVFLELPQSAQL